MNTNSVQGKRMYSGTNRNRNRMKNAEVAYKIQLGMRQPRITQND